VKDRTFSAYSIISVKHTTGLLNDVLLIAKQKQAVKVSTNTVGTYKILSRLNRGNSIYYELSHGLPFCAWEQFVKALDVLLRQNFSNLLSNVAIYPQGTIQFDLICEPGKVVFAFKMKVFGIPIADQTKLSVTFLI